MTVPTFVVAGAQKAGTNSLREYLAAHPEVFMAPTELHFFNRDEYYANPAWYANWFRGSERYYAVGEVTPDYDRHMDRIRQWNPNMQIIFALRNPIYRAISAYWMAIKVHRYDLPDIETVLDPEWEDKTEYRFLERGRYVEALDRITKHFPSQNVLVYRLEDLEADPETTLRGITLALGISYKPWHGKRYFAGQYGSPGSELLERLAEYYAPYNRLLSYKYNIQVEDWGI